MPKFLRFWILIFLIRPTFSQQHYDNSECNSEMQYPGSNYLCNAHKSSCESFIVYRAQKHYQTLSSISSLFNTNTSHLSSYNKMSQTDPNNIQHGQEIIVPVNCSCPDRFSEAFFLYNASIGESLSAIACEVYEGLVKAQSLIEENQESRGDKQNFYLLRVPVKCACVDTSDARNGTNFLVTYPIIRNDSIDKIAHKFGVPQEMISDANRLGHFDTVFPLTTLLIPTKDVPILNYDVYVCQNDSIDKIAHKFGVPQEMISDANRLGHFDTVFPLTTLLIPTKDVPILNYDVMSSPPDPNPSPRPEVPLNNNIPRAKLKNLKAILGVVIFGAVLIFIVSGILILARKKFDRRRFDTSSSQTSKSSDLSPEFLHDMSKFKLTLTCYRMEELRVATEDFDESLAIGSAVYKGRIGDIDVAIEKIDSAAEGNHVISILTKINHINVVKLEGCCIESSQYLVYEFVNNGSLRDCLSNLTMAKLLTWDRRIQIAFDIAVGIHYMHYCTRPNYVHHNISSKSILITENWRAKISGFRRARSRSCIEEMRGTSKNDTTVDVYAFGMILLEVLSGKQVTTNGMSFKDFLEILAGKELQESSKSLEKLKTFMDPVMEKYYSLEGAVFLACLAKACLQEDPLERPSMNDVLKVLSIIL
ncbi:serine/threonine receptor-like kinase NFP [Olea europaea var. sylvestris]|uniref:serine/threonine receptor-like kinase NFP n=1 Tax=Olea europaea var. sylvestris TaxID=158386 RepID=UPI000C1CEC2C|nr:serine/threonine receptor-like kinase NFP [Olea europaea var. sylvestris]